MTKRAMTPQRWRSEMWRLIPVLGYTPIPRLARACALARPNNGWVDACSDYPLRRPDRRPLAMEVYLPEWDR